MADYIEVRGVKIGAGIPKICVPVVGTTEAEIKAAAGGKTGCRGVARGLVFRCGR